jgi:hypothetical protein
MEGPVLLSFSYLKQSSEFFTFWKNSDRLAGTFRWSENPSTAWLLPSPQKIPLAENKFLQASKGDENTKEKSRQCFTHVG